MRLHVASNIHILDIFLHGVFMIPHLLAPFLQQEAWRGSDSSPHSKVDLEELKTCLINGSQVSFRKDSTPIWLKQGPSDHHRANPTGVILIALPLDGDSSDSAGEISRDKFIYLIKSGDDHATYASFTSYRYVSGSWAK